MAHLAGKSGYVYTGAAVSGIKSCGRRTQAED